MAVIKQPPKEYTIDQMGGMIKQKGSMVTNPELGNSVDNMIIPIALNYYFIQEIPIEKTIKNERDIYKFCRSPKVAKKFTVWYNGEKQQNLNRFFVSNKGTYLYKQKQGGNLQNMLKGYTVELLNICKDRDAWEYDINYNYYISETRKLLDLIEPKQISLF